MTDAPNPVLCAIDTPALEVATKLTGELARWVGGFKLGLEFFGANGPEGVRAIAKSGASICLDLKLHDIPNTVAGAVKSLVPLQPALITIHASGGRAMLTAAAAAAREAATSHDLPRPRLVGVTVMTSLDESDLRDIGQEPVPASQVDRLAFLAHDAGLDGVVCSALEIERLRRRFGRSFILMVPGVRPDWTTQDDQKRITTPAEARRLGADYLVIGRPITRATDPAAAAKRIAKEIDAGQI